LADKEPPLLPANLPDGWWAVWQTYTGGLWGLIILWHQHFNTDPDNAVRYLSGTNAPLLQSIGEIDCREEVG